MNCVLAWLGHALFSATFWTALATIVVGFYTYYARQQWKAMADTFGEAKRSADAAQDAWSKEENWRIAREMSMDELAGTDLGEFLKAS